MKNYSKTFLILLRYQDKIFEMVAKKKSCRDIAKQISKQSIHTNLKSKIGYVSVCNFIKKQKEKYYERNINDENL